MNIYSFKTKNAPKYNLRASFLKNFPGGQAPQTPLALACYEC